MVHLYSWIPLEIADVHELLVERANAGLTNNQLIGRRTLLSARPISSVMDIKAFKLTSIKGTPALEDYAYKKFLALNKFLSNVGLPQDLYIEIGKSTTHHKEGRVFRAEAMLELSGRVLRAEAEENDLYAAIDATHDELARQIKEFKAKIFSKQKKQARRVEE